MTTSGNRRQSPQTEIRFPIERRTDKHRKQYWLGKTDMPADLDLRECTFFIFVGDNPEVCIRRRQEIRERRVEEHDHARGYSKGEEELRRRDLERDEEEGDDYYDDDGNDYYDGDDEDEQ